MNGSTFLVVKVDKNSKALVMEELPKDGELEVKGSICFHVDVGFSWID